MTPKPVTRKPGSMPRIRTVGAGIRGLFRIEDQGSRIKDQGKGYASGWNSGSRGSSSPQAGAYEALAHLALQVSQARLLVAFSRAVLLDLSLGARHGAFAFEARAHEFLARVALQFFFARLLIAGAHAFLLLLLGLSRRLSLRLLRRLALVLAARERRCDHHRAKQNGE